MTAAGMFAPFFAGLRLPSKWTRQSFSDNIYSVRIWFFDIGNGPAERIGLSERGYKGGRPGHM